MKQIRIILLTLATIFIASCDKHIEKKWQFPVTLGMERSEVIQILGSQVDIKYE